MGWIVDELAARRESLSQGIAAKEDRIVAISSQGSDAVRSDDEILLDELNRQLAREIAVHTENHPNVIALRERIARLDESTEKSSGLSPSAERMVAELRREIERMREQRARDELEMAELNERIDRIPLVGEEFDALEREWKVLREDYLSSLRKVQGAELADSGGGDRP